MKSLFKMGGFALLTVVVACKHKRQSFIEGCVVIAQTAYKLGNAKKSYQVNAFLDSNSLELYEKVRINPEILLHRFRPHEGNSNQYVDTTHATGAYDKLFGKMVAVELIRYPQNPPLEKAISADSMSGYVPLSFDLAMDAKDTIQNKILVSKNVSLHWTPDPNNSFISVNVLFFPEDVQNFRHKTAKKVRKYHKVPDNGHFIIPSNDFKDIPVGGKFEIEVEREQQTLGRSEKSGLSAIEIFGISRVKLSGSPSSTCDDCLEIDN